jgi:Gpi18-like mannosyltransferase
MLSSISTKQKIVLLILLAVLLRLAIMPFFMHMDMLSEFRRINFSFENNEFYPGFNRLTVFYIEMLFYSVTHFFVVLPEVVLYLPDPAHSTATTTTHFIFAGDNYAYRHIFLFKLPYLIFDLLCGLVVWRYFEGHRLQMFALAFWLFNPVTIYATYFFGRFEVISIFFLLATALALKQEKLILASIAFGLALNCREINLIFLPAFGLLMLNGLRSNTFALKTLLLSASIIVAAVFIP